MHRLVVALLALLILPGCQGPSDHRVELGVPHIAQETLLCVPTSAAMVLAFYGDPQEPRRLKAVSRGRAYDPAAPFDDFTITMFADMKRGLAAQGYVWSDAAFADTPQGYVEGLKVVEDELRQGRPVLVDITANGVGHTVVVSGFDDRARRLFMVDPARPAPGKITIGYDDFAAFWNEHAYGGQFRALMKTAPKV